MSTQTTHTHTLEMIITTHFGDIPRVFGGMHRAWLGLGGTIFHIDSMVQIQHRIFSPLALPIPILLHIDNKHIFPNLQTLSTSLSTQCRRCQRQRSTTLRPTQAQGVSKNFNHTLPFNNRCILKPPYTPVVDSLPRTHRSKNSESGSGGRISEPKRSGSMGVRHRVEQFWPAGLCALLRRRR